MMDVIATNQVLGATVSGIDLSQPLAPQNLAKLLESLGTYGVLRFPGQTISPENLRDFSSHFGGLQRTVSNANEPGIPEVSILSNIVENGKPIGIADAGQDWHTDMSYNTMIGFVNVLYAIKIPRRNGRILGSTRFANMHSAYDGLPNEIKQELAGMTATHDFNKFWEDMRSQPGSKRPPLTPEQRAKRPPSVHPVFLTHPITGGKVLYCNPGYTIRINELDERESDRMLQILFNHQLQSKYQITHEWAEGDVLMWDHIGTLHNAVPDYEPHEHRLIKRCQVMADKVFDPEFMRTVRDGLATPG